MFVADVKCSQATWGRDNLEQECRDASRTLWWSPYVAIVLVQSFVPSFQPPSGIEFAVMWLANTNSAVNVFIYSSTNTQFRRQCVRLASGLCCSRLSCKIQPLIHFTSRLSNGPITHM